jgi:aryl-alcohol dehydrogenase-like predicted oxidoreductase
MSSSDSTTTTTTQMQYTRLGNTGLKVSKLTLGCMSFGDSRWQGWPLAEEESFKLLKEAHDIGFNFFDTADVYSHGESERILGNFIRKYNIPRENIVIATKVYGGVDKSGQFRDTFSNPNLIDRNARGLSKKHILHAVKDSLERLQTDYIDLYIIHRWDYDTPIEETMEALHDCVKAGYVRYIGASSMYAWQFAKAQQIAKERGWTQFVSMQNLYNVLYREEEREMIPLCADQGIGLTPWSPLARGDLAKIEDETITTRGETDRWLKVMKEHTEADKIIRQRVLELSKKKNCTTAQLSLAWLLHKKTVVSPIIGVTKLEQIRDCVKCFDIKLSEEELKYLEEPYQAKAVFGHS